MEQTVGSTELVWNLLFSTTGADGRLCLALSERIKVVIRTRVLTVMVTLLRMHIRGHDEQAVDARVNIPSHGQCTKDFFPDVIRGWLVLQRSGLSESSKKTVRTRWARP